MRNITILLAVLLYLQTNAQEWNTKGTSSVNAITEWTTDTDVNTLVTEVVSEDMKAIATSDGQTYVVFWKNVGEPLNYELRLQLLNAAGDRQFGDDGMLISNSIPMASFTMVWSIAIDANDNLIVGLTGTGDYSGRIFKIDTEGNLLWGSDGIVISSAVNIKLLVMENNELMVSWIPGDEALMQKYDVDGNAVWATPQAVECSAGKTSPGDMLELSDGGFIMVFHAYNYGVSSTLYAQRYNADGESQWAEPTQLSDQQTVYNTNYSCTQDGDVVYYAYTAAHSNRFDSYLQRINPDGSLPWGINGMDFDVNETDFEMRTLIAHSQGSAYVWSICTYTDPNQSKYGEYVQKFDKETGARQLSENAKMLFALSDDFKIHNGNLTLVNDQPFFLINHGYDDGATPTTLNVLLLDENGDFAWPEEIKPMATYPANKKRVHFTENVNNQSVAVFIEDKGEGFRIYAQNHVLGAMPPPSSPVLLSPENEATGLELSNTFSWQSVEGALTYSLQIADDNTFSNLVVDESGLSDTDYDATMMNYETTYYWRVLASNAVGDSEWSEVWSFTTEDNVGINDFTSDDISIYPNPVSDYMIVDVKQPANIEICALNGSVLKAMTINEQSHRISLSDLSNGTYIITIFNADGELIISKKMIKN